MQPSFGLDEAEIAIPLDTTGPILFFTNLFRHASIGDEVVSVFTKGLIKAQ